MVEWIDVLLLLIQLTGLFDRIQFDGYKISIGETKWGKIIVSLSKVSLSDNDFAVQSFHDAVLKSVFLWCTIILSFLCVELMELCFGVYVEECFVGDILIKNARLRNQFVYDNGRISGIQCRLFVSNVSFLSNWLMTSCSTFAGSTDIVIESLVVQRIKANTATIDEVNANIISDVPAAVYVLVKNIGNCRSLKVKHDPIDLSLKINKVISERCGAKILVDGFVCSYLQRCRQRIYARELSFKLIIERMQLLLPESFSLMDLASLSVDWVVGFQLCLLEGKGINQLPFNKVDARLSSLFLGIPVSCWTLYCDSAQKFMPMLALLVSNYALSVPHLTEASLRVSELQMDFAVTRNIDGLQNDCDSDNEAVD